MLATCQCAFAVRSMVATGLGLPITETQRLCFETILARVLFFWGDGMKVRCIICDHETKIGEETIEPGNIHFVCDECGQRWEVNIGFYELDDDE